MASSVTHNKTVLSPSAGTAKSLLRTGCPKPWRYVPSSTLISPETIARCFFSSAWAFAVLLAGVHKMICSPSSLIAASAYISLSRSSYTSGSVQSASQQHSFSLCAAQVHPAPGYCCLINHLSVLSSTHNNQVVRTAHRLTPRGR